MNRIITISREFGSGGRTVGLKTAEKLGIPCYDSTLIDKVAETSGFCEEYIREHGEYAASGGWFAHALAARDQYGHTNQDTLFIAQSHVIEDLAKKGPCVIVGRCADYILRDKADLLTVFIHADMESRAKYIVEHFGESADSPEKRLRDKDKRRAAYYQIYTDMKWGDCRNYHLSLDAGKLGIDRCADILAEAYKAMSD